MEQEPKVVPQEEVQHRLEVLVRESLAEIKNDLLPHLKHGEAKRLLMATLEYPQTVADFSQESHELIRAFSAAKAVTDAMISLGVEVVISKLVERERDAQEKTEEVENAES